MRNGGRNYRPAARLFLVFLLILLAVGCRRGPEKEISIVYTNDLHGHILPERVRDWSGRTGGYAVFVGWLKETRRENEKKGIPTLLLDAGDIFMGTVEGNQTRGRAVIRLMDLAGYDAMALGNHEFDFGFYNLQQLAELADFPFLSSNVLRKETGRILSFTRPYIVKKYDGLTVGIIGVTTAEVPEITLPRNVGQVIFKDPIPAVQAYQRLLEQEGVDLLIVLSHLGLKEDTALARAIPEIDLIVGGHSHDLLTRPLRVGEGGTLICQAGSYGRFAGRLDLRVDTGGDAISAYESTIFANRQWSRPADIATNRLLEEIKSEVGNEYDQMVGQALQDVLTDDDDESPLGDLIADAVREAGGAAAAFQNPYGIRGDFLEGPITRRDVFTVLPFNDTIITMELTGRQIRELIEQSLTMKKGMLQISGLRVEYSVDRPEGKRVLSAAIGGNPLDDASRYTVATNGFLAGGGDYFSTFSRGEAPRDTGILLREAVSTYIRNHTPLYPANFSRDRWVKR
ncbi:MAG: bifunctional UDP-sugar hydrolase/5'-nucleotidase [PVC group bacterium]